MGSINYEAPALILSGNAGELGYTLDSGEVLRVTMGSGDDAQSFDLKAYDDGEEHSIDFAEVLDALPLATPEGPVADEDDNGLTFTPTEVSVDMYDSSGAAEGVGFTVPVIKGLLGDRSLSAADALEQLTVRGLLSQGPQQRRTFAGAEEYLTVLTPKRSEAAIAQEAPLIRSFRVYFADGSFTTIINETPLQDDYEILSYRVDPAVFEYSLEDNSSPVVAWDVSFDIRISKVNSAYHPPLRYFETLLSTPTIRYILRHGRVSGASFVFVNDLGGLDTIHAEGFRTLGSYAPVDFLHKGYRRPLSVNPDTVYEASSGQLATKAERDFWLAFLRSPEKWWYGPDGEPEKITMSESSPEFSAGELNEVSFKFRRSCEPGGSLPDYSETLESYEP